MSKAFKAAVAALSRKEALLDGMDDQLLEMDSTLPMDTMSNDFDMLATKREELEQNIRKMRERIELISAWEQLKNGDWSEEVKSLLKDLDVNIADIADNADGSAVAPMMDPMAIPAAPAAPIPPAAPAVAAPPAAPAPVSAIDPGAEVDTSMTDPAEELPAPTASSKKSNYEVQVKKANSTPSTLKKEGNMTQTANKSSLKTELTAAKTKREISAKAQTRTAAAWAIAKTMLPDAPLSIQTHFATTLLQNSTKVLTAAVRQTATNAYAAKLADDIKRKHKLELNDLLEEPSVLTSAKREVESEVKGDAKNASKTADDRKDAGPQTETYNDGRGCGGGKHTEPAELDAGKAGDRPADTVNKSEESDATLKAAAAKKKAHGADCEGCEKCEGKKAAQSAIKAASASCAECKEGSMCSKHASALKYADDMPVEAPAAEGTEPAPAMDAPPADAPMDAPAPEMGEPGAAAEGETVLTEETKMEMVEKIDEAEQAIQGLLADITGENEAAEEGVGGMSELGLPEEEITMEEQAPAEGGEELKIEDIFDQGSMEDKESSLANQEDDNNSVMADGDSVESFFGPSASQDLEASLEPQMASIQDMFAVEGSDADPLAYLFAGKEAGDVAGMDVLPSFTSETAKHFESDTAKGDDRDAASDHESDIWAEALSSIKVEDQGSKRDKQDSTNELKTAPEAKKAAKKVAYTGSIRPTAPNKTAGSDMGEALLGSFFGDE